MMDSDTQPDPYIDQMAAEHAQEFEAAHASMLSELVLTGITVIDDWLDTDVGWQYAEQPLAHTWARVTKVCEESGEVWRALSNLTGENPRKGICGTEEELLGELADIVCAGLFAMQHLTKDADLTHAVFARAFLKARDRAEDAARAARAS